MYNGQVANTFKLKKNTVVCSILFKYGIESLISWLFWRHCRLNNEISIARYYVSVDIIKVSLELDFKQTTSTFTTQRTRPTSKAFILVDLPWLSQRYNRLTFSTIIISFAQKKIRIFSNSTHSIIRNLQMHIVALTSI